MPQPLEASATFSFQTLWMPSSESLTALRKQEIGRPRSAPPSSMWASVLDEAMMDLLDHVGEATVAQLQAGISSRDPVVKVRRFELGLKNRRGSIGKGSPEWGRYVDALVVVAEMRRQKMVPNPGG